MIGPPGISINETGPSSNSTDSGFKPNGPPGMGNPHDMVNHNSMINSIGMFAPPGTPGIHTYVFTPTNNLTADVRGTICSFVLVNKRPWMPANAGDK